MVGWLDVWMSRNQPHDGHSRVTYPKRAKRHAHLHTLHLLTQTGTLSSLVSLADTISKHQAVFEGVTDKIVGAWLNQSIMYTHLIQLLL